MIIKKAAAGVLVLGLGLGIANTSACMEWPAYGMSGYSNQDFYTACLDGDGKKETVVEVFRNLEGDTVQRYCTRIHKDGGGYVWAFKRNDEFFVDSECKGVFTKLGPGEKLTPPECARKR